MLHQTKETGTIDPKSWIILLVLGLIWGSSYFLISKGLEVFSAVQVASLRLSISCLAFFPIFLWKFKDVPRKAIKYLLVIGFMGSGIPAIMFALAQTKLSTSITGVLGSTTPLFTLIVGMLFFGLPYVRNRVFGVIVGLLGALTIILLGDKDAIGGEPLYAILPFVATFCYAISTNTVKSKLQDLNPLALSSTAFMLLAPVVLTILFTSGFTDVVQSDPKAWSAIGYVSILSIFGTMIGAILFFWLIQLTNPIFATMVSYMIPLTATLIGLFLGEPISLVFFIGLTLILLGVYLSRR